MSLADYGSGMSGLAGQLHQQNTFIPKADIFEELRSAQNRFSAACHAFAKASSERDEADKALRAISEKATQQIQDALYDPTVPQPACELPTRHNGRY